MKTLSQAIISELKLNMKDLTRESSRKYGPATWFRGTKWLDGVFVTPDVDYYGSRFIPYWSGMGYNEAAVVEIPHQSLFVQQVLKVVRQQARRIKCGLTGPERRYLQSKKYYFRNIKYIARQEVYTSLQGNLLSPGS